MTIKLSNVNGRLEVECPYSKQFINGAHQVAGKWEDPVWSFPGENEGLVRKLLTDVFLHDGSPQPTVTMNLHLTHITMCRELWVGSQQILRKKHRDSGPFVYGESTVIQGSLKLRGGSMKNPEITHTGDCVIRVKNIPLSVAQALEDGKGFIIVDDAVAPVDSELSDDELRVVNSLLDLNSEQVQNVLNEYYRRLMYS